MTSDEVRLIQRAISYLEHPDVVAIPFACPSANVAKDLREIIRGAPITATPIAALPQECNARGGA